MLSLFLFILTFTEHTYNFYIYNTRRVPILISSLLSLGRGPPLGCRAEIRTRACHTGSRRKGLCGRSLSETGDTVSHVGIFEPALWTAAPLTFSLVHISLPPSFPVWVSIQYTCIQCVRRGGIWSHRREEGLRQVNTCRKVPLQVNFLWRHFALVSI